MSTLAIKGHATRGEEVIEILKMLGGSSRNICSASALECDYYITDKGIIDHWYCRDEEEFIVFSLEEFLEKYPYKVGDTVQFRRATSCGTVFRIEGMKWMNHEVIYIISPLYLGYGKSFASADELRPFPEEDEIVKPSDKFFQDMAASGGDKAFEQRHTNTMISREVFVEKAVDWLCDRLPNEMGFVDANLVICDFRKAMEG